MNVTIIHHDAEHEQALARIERLLERDPEPGTPDGDELRLLALVVADYETQKYPTLRPDPIAALRFRMEQQGLKQKDLVPYIGQRSHVSEVLSGERRLTVRMIQRLRDGLGIPADVLVGS